jgi:uncharacterized protein YlxP (DUF503 family)
LTIGILIIDIHLPGARSLKEKRQVMRRLKDRLRARHNISVVETEEHADLWQRSGLVIAAVASRRDPLENLFEKIFRESESLVPGHVIESGREYLDGAGGHDSGWQGEWS